MSDNEDKTALYEIVIDNKDDFTSITAGDRELTVTAVYSSADSDEEKSQSSSVSLDGKRQDILQLQAKRRLLLIVVCRVKVIRALPIQKKQFDVLSANTVCENEAVFDASLKPDRMYSGFKNKDASFVSDFGRSCTKRRKWRFKQR